MLVKRLTRGCISGSLGESGLVSRGSQGLRSPLEWRRGSLGAHWVASRVHQVAVLCIGWQLFASGGQSIGASASVLPMNIQGWFPLGLTGLISLLSNGLARVSRVLCDAKCFICWFYPHILIYLPLKPQFVSLLMVQWLRLRAPHAEDVGSTANQGTKIPHAAQCGQINKYNFKNK